MKDKALGECGNLIVELKEELAKLALMAEGLSNLICTTAIRQQRALSQMSDFAMGSSGEETSQQLDQAAMLLAVAAGKADAEASSIHHCINLANFKMDSMAEKVASPTFRRSRTQFGVNFRLPRQPKGVL